MADLLAQLPEAGRAAFTVVCADVDAGMAASQLLENSVTVIHPTDAELGSGPLLIVNAGPDQARRLLQCQTRANQTVWQW